MPTESPDDHSRDYLRLLMFAALIGITLSVTAFAFLVAMHELEDVVWHPLPSGLGYDHVPAWCCLDWDWSPPSLSEWPPVLQ